MNAGETKRYDCTRCEGEFDITYEPKAKGNPQAIAGFPPVTVATCPSCGGEIKPSDGSDEGDASGDEADRAVEVADAAKAAFDEAIDGRDEAEKAKRPLKPKKSPAPAKGKPKGRR